MAFSKVIYNGTTLIDLTQDTVAAGNLMSPNTAHDAAGLAVTGTASGGSSTALIVDSEDSHGGTIRNVTTTSEVRLQANKNITPSSSTQVVVPDTGYDGFAQITVEAINSGGNIASGSVTNAELTKNVSVSIPFAPHGFVFFADNSTFPTDTAWKTLLLIVLFDNEEAYVMQRYSTSNIMGADREFSNFSYNSSTQTLSGSVNYNFAAVTYNWIAW